MGTLYVAHNQMSINTDLHITLFLTGANGRTPAMTNLEHATVEIGPEASTLQEAKDLISDIGRSMGWFYAEYQSFASSWINPKYVTRADHDAGGQVRVQLPFSAFYADHVYIP